jgi:uncharacterized tellurite resistance protein B-like protein
MDPDNRSGVRDLVTCGDTVLDKLNFVKYNYASALRKQQDVVERIEAAKMMADVVNSPVTGDTMMNIHGAVRMVVPLLLDKRGDE